MLYYFSEHLGQFTDLELYKLSAYHFQFKRTSKRKYAEENSIYSLLPQENWLKIATQHIYYTNTMSLLSKENCISRHNIIHIHIVLETTEWKKNLILPSLPSRRSNIYIKKVLIHNLYTEQYIYVYIHCCKWHYRPCCCLAVCQKGYFVRMKQYIGWNQWTIHKHSPRTHIDNQLL